MKTRIEKTTRPDQKASTHQLNEAELAGIRAGAEVVLSGVRNPKSGGSYK